MKNYERIEVARCKAHASFDLLWKNRHMTRTEAYRWLKTKLRMREASECHISKFGQTQCRRVEQLANDFLINKLLGLEDL